jgi:glycogen operon protein
LRGQQTSFWFIWHDRFRDDVRRFWRGDVGVDLLATRRAIFADPLGLPCHSVNFLAAHAGVTLADTVATPSEPSGEWRGRPRWPWFGAKLA